MRDELFSLLFALDGIGQSPRYHPEGDALFHSLQVFELAHRSVSDPVLWAAALFHDVGKALSITNHAAIGAELLRPYVSRDVYQILRTHQDFQGRHYYQHFGRDTNLRDQHRDQPWYALAEQFADEWDQVAFDPDAPTAPLEHFEPMVREVFARPIN